MASVLLATTQPLANPSRTDERVSERVTGREEALTRVAMEYQPISLKNLAFDLAFHPTSRILAVGDISGDVHV